MLRSLRSSRICPLATVTALMALGLIGRADSAARATATSTSSGRGGTTHAPYCGHERARFHGHTVVLGVNDQLGDRGPSDLQCATGGMAADRLGYVRDQLSWADVEVAPNQYDFTFYDQVMTALAAHGLQWLPVVLPAPTFLDRGGIPQNNGFPPPANSGQFGAFMKMLVQRYGPHGLFWRMHPTLPYDPVRAWQVWNEPSLEAYWVPKPSPSEYETLLGAAYRAIKSADPHALVVAAGVPFGRGVQFYSHVYQAGGRRYFDVLAFHAYSSKVHYAESDLIKLRRMMDRHGDSRKPIWVTEFGWASSGPPSPFTAGAKTPGWVSRFLKFMLRNRRRLKLEKLFFYEWRDPPNQPEWWGVNMGMYRGNATARPVASVIASAARRLNR